MNFKKTLFHFHPVLVTSSNCLGRSKDVVGTWSSVDVT